MSGKRHVTATAWNAPIDAPVAQIPMSCDLQSWRIAGATSCLMYWWNWFVIQNRWSGVCAFEKNSRPATLSTE